jgi:probable aminopeptidase NPEPL1
MSMIELTSQWSDLLTDAHTLVVAARKADLSDGWPFLSLPAAIKDTAMRLALDAKPGVGAQVSTLLPEGAGIKTLVLIPLFDKVSRHLSDARAQDIHLALRNVARPEGGKVAITVALPTESAAQGAVTGITRAYPLYSRKSGNKNSQGEVRVLLQTKNGAVSTGLDNLRAVRDSVRLACRLVDMPPAELNTAVFESEAREAAAGIAGVSVHSIVGDDLLEHGLRGLHAVGRTAMVAPRLVVLEYSPAGATGAPIALIGKGLVYDTGGLSLKIVGDRMLTMKCDMGGAAAVLGAFLALAKTGVQRKIVAALAMAENAIGPDAYRPDDVIELHSGKTMEVNNTDAEGRICLADAASYVARKWSPDVLIDAATLTGAQLIATGKYHAALVCNDGELEAKAVAAGLSSGDHAMPILFSPELHTGEYKSAVADFRNSVADRNNASSSASGLWVWMNIDDLTELKWLHIDLAGPAFLDNRGTGYGIGLITDLVRALA